MGLWDKPILLTKVPKSKLKKPKAFVPKKAKPKKKLVKITKVVTLKAFMKKYKSHWVKVVDPDTNIIRRGILCDGTKENGCKVLYLDQDPTFDYVAKRRVVAVGIKFEAIPANEKMIPKCGAFNCTVCTKDSSTNSKALPQ